MFDYALSEKVALITGVNRKIGIGAAIAPFSSAVIMLLSHSYFAVQS